MSLVGIIISLIIFPFMIIDFFVFLSFFCCSIASLTEQKKAESLGFAFCGLLSFAVLIGCYYWLDWLGAFNTLFGWQND